MSVKFNKADPVSIERYSKLLIGKNIRDFLLKEENKLMVSNKGNFGNILETEYFGISPGNSAGPDFPEAGLELKSTGVRRLANGGFSAKEKLILSIINFEDIVKEDWENSSFLKKNIFLLLVFYLYEKNTNAYDLKIILTGLWKLPEKDLRIIKGDWEKIVSTINEGNAHELSESKTNYLIASRKGAGGGRDYRNQPYSNIQAKQRAFAFRNKYLTSIFRTIQERHKPYQSIIKNIDEFKEFDTFEDVVMRRFEPFLNRDIRYIEKYLNTNLNPEAKGYYAAISRELIKRVLGVKRLKSEIDEFQKANIKLKTMRIRKSTNMPKESVSFPAFKCKELIDQEDWGESETRELLSQRFLFVIFKEDDSGGQILKKVTFWSVPEKHLDKEIKEVWEITKELLSKSIIEGLPKISSGMKAHVRPHGTKDERDVLPNGELIRKHSFWLNARYLKEQITKELS